MNIGTNTHKKTNQTAKIRKLGESQSCLMVNLSDIYGHDSVVLVLFIQIYFFF